MKVEMILAEQKKSEKKSGLTGNRAVTLTVASGRRRGQVRF